MDLWEVRRLIADGEPEAALALCRAELLQELDDNWVLDAREELDRDMAAALRELADRARAAGDWASALSWARRRAALGRLEESATAGLIQILIEAGDARAALEEFARLEQRLGSELGVRVSAATAALVEPLSVAAGAPGDVSPDGSPGVSPDGGPGVSPDGSRASAGTGRRAQPAGRVPGRAAGFVGREQELAGLVAAWRAASAGAGRAVLLEGEGGIGKTRLIEELQAAVQRAPGARGGAPGPAARMPACVMASAAGPGPAAPFGIWADALGDLVAETRAAARGRAVDRDPGQDRPGAGQPGGRPPSGRLAADPQLERVRLCEAVVQFLIWASRPAPLLLAMEDLHAADAASLELIAYAGRRLNRLPVLLVLTRRLEPGGRDLDAVLAALRSRRALATAIRLGPLPDDAARALIRETADVPRRSSVRSPNAPPAARSSPWRPPALPRKAAWSRAWPAPSGSRSAGCPDRPGRSLSSPPSRAAGWTAPRSLRFRCPARLAPPPKRWVRVCCRRTMAGPGSGTPSWPTPFTRTSPIRSGPGCTVPWLSCSARAPGPRERAAARPRRPRSPGASGRRPGRPGRQLPGHGGARGAQRRRDGRSGQFPDRGVADRPG